jgi:hypothetical protein
LLYIIGVNTIPNPLTITTQLNNIDCHRQRRKG